MHGHPKLLVHGQRLGLSVTARVIGQGTRNGSFFSLS